MVKNLEQSRRSLPARKRVSFDDNSKTEEAGDYTAVLSFADETDRSDISCIDTSFLNSNSIERLLNVAQTLDSRKRDRIEGSVEISKKNAHSHESRRNATANDCSEDSRHHINTRHDEETKLHPPEEKQMRYCTRTVRSPPPPSLAQIVVFSQDLKNDSESRLFGAESRNLQRPDTAGHLDVIASQTLAIGSGTREGVRYIDGNESSSSPSTGNISTRRNSDGPDLCRGYSSQRRHGRKASLGTAEITRLIPTLVSENEEFRYKEYGRKLSAHAPGGGQNVTV